jgi:hypothetical protein
MWGIPKWLLGGCPTDNTMPATDDLCSIILERFG